MKGDGFELAHLYKRGGGSIGQTKCQGMYQHRQQHQKMWRGGGGRGGEEDEEEEQEEEEEEENGTNAADGDGWQQSVVIRPSRLPACPCCWRG